MDQNPEFQMFFDKFEKEIVEPLVAEIMKEQFSVPPPNLLVPEKVWKEDTRKNLMSVCGAKELREKLISAQVTVLGELKTELPPVDFQKFQENWKQGVDQLIVTPEKELSKEQEQFPPSLQSIMGITEETISHIYDVGVRYFQKLDYHKASDIFYLVTLIDYLRHNAWTSLGLCEMENLNFDQALEAFGMASITDIDNPLPYITSAECSIELGKLDDAKQFLDLARAAVLHQPQGEQEGFLKQLNRVQKKIK